MCVCVCIYEVVSTCRFADLFKVQEVILISRHCVCRDFIERFDWAQSRLVMVTDSRDLWGGQAADPHHKPCD